MNQKTQRLNNYFANHAFLKLTNFGVEERKINLADVTVFASHGATLM